MKFSIVIPLYNKAPYINRALDSVINQTVQDFEIIVVDDGSTDNGAEIVQQIRDPRIRLIRQSNAGVSATRNRGIMEFNNELIAFLDADDEWGIGFLEDIFILINQYPNCGAYATSYKIIEANGNVNVPRVKGLPTGRMGIISNIFGIFQTGLPFTASSIVIPKKTLLDVNGFPIGVGRGEDLYYLD